MGTGRICSFNRQKELFRYWVYDHGGKYDYKEKHNRTVGPGQNIDYLFKGNFNNGTTIEWQSETNGKKYKITYSDGEEKQGTFRDIQFKLGKIIFTGDDKIAVSVPNIDPDERIILWDANQREPENGYKENVINEGR